MKKFTLIFLLIFVFVFTGVAFGQTCDCDELLVKIDDLNKQIDILKGYSSQIIIEDDFISVGNNLIYFKQFDVYEGKNEYGLKYDGLTITFKYRNESNNIVNFDNSLGYRIYQNGVEIISTGSSNTDIHLKPNAEIWIALHFRLRSTSGVIEADIWPLDNPDDIYSAVIYNLE